jgi:hypothetical protein
MEGTMGKDMGEGEGEEIWVSSRRWDTIKGIVTIKEITTIRMDISSNSSIHIKINTNLSRITISTTTTRVSEEDQASTEATSLTISTSIIQTSTIPTSTVLTSTISTLKIRPTRAETTGSNSASTTQSSHKSRKISINLSILTSTDSICIFPYFIKFTQ